MGSKTLATVSKGFMGTYKFPKHLDEHFSLIHVVTDRETEMITCNLQLSNQIHRGGTPWPRVEVTGIEFGLGTLSSVFFLLCHTVS